MITTEKVMVTAPSGVALPSERVVATDPDLPDLRIVPMTKIRQILIRTIRTYLQALVGNLGNLGIGGAVAVTTFANLTSEQQIALKQVYSALEFYQVLLIAISTAVAPAVMAFILNLAELFSDLDSPKTRA